MECRKTLVISLLQPNPGEDFATQTLPRKLVRAERSKTTALGKAVVVGGPSTIIAPNASISHVSAVDVDMRKTQSFIIRRGQSFSLERLLRSISTVHVACEPFPEYVKRKRAFRLATQDGAEYVFRCAD
ncbi:hypothetical protein Q1695_008024 [Nippostrongylus brasiliensis]|nr:hypothetical protein Q1695_008024 [Nippostrongylus brasiliensis]